MKENTNIRNAARIANVSLWKIARELSISEPTLTRWLRFPLDAKKEERVMQIIDELSKEGC
ncbi:MAG: hypothetical protein VB064_02430 [Oscillospiraceae bacterium]|nr:hypothetical protein [Oscillospiraceae bacterium]